MKLYRVITENKNYQDITKYLMEHKLDATIIQANDLQQGQIEKSIVIELVDSGTPSTRAITEQDIEKFVYWLKKHNSQDKVMLQEINAEIWLM